MAKRKSEDPEMDQILAMARYQIESGYDLEGNKISPLKRIFRHMVLMVAEAWHGSEVSGTATGDNYRARMHKKPGGKVKVQFETNDRPMKAKMKVKAKTRTRIIDVE